MRSAEQNSFYLLTVCVFNIISPSHPVFTGLINRCQNSAKRECYSSKCPTKTDDGLGQNKVIFRYSRFPFLLSSN
jgi:hypothetical protein